LTPEETIAAYMEARRLGQTEEICALETDEYETFVYGEPGDACLEDSANIRPQPVWAEEVVIVDIETDGDFAAATIQPNAGGSKAIVKVGLENVDGVWMISSFA
jgi:hypothetical protein